MPLSLTRSCAFAALVVALAAAAGCQPNGSQAKATPPPPKVTVVKPVLRPVQSYYEYTGHTGPVETVQVVARVKGVLTGIHFTEGEEVPEGKLLYEIEKREYETMVAKAKADVDKAEADVEKAKALEVPARMAAKTGAGGKVELAQREAETKGAEASVLQAKAALRTATIQLGYTDIKAPITGVIGRTLVTQGNLVGQNETTLLTTILRTDELYVYFDVPERDLLEYMTELQKAGRLTSPPQIPFQVRVAAKGEEWHDGVIDYAEAAVHTGTGTARIRGRIKNPVRPGTKNVRALVPGLYTDVRVPRGLPGDKLLIPERALQSGQQGRFVYVVAEGELKDEKTGQVTKAQLVQPRTVTLGPRPEGAAGWDLVGPDGKPLAVDGQPLAVGPLVAVEKGLKPDDRVIVAGMQRARPRAPADPAEGQLKEQPPGRPKSPGPATPSTPAAPGAPTGPNNTPGPGPNPPGGTPGSGNPATNPGTNPGPMPGSPNPGQKK